jgi:hypothetical protein
VCQHGWAQDGLLIWCTILGSTNAACWPDVLSGAAAAAQFRLCRASAPFGGAVLTLSSERPLGMFKTHVLCDDRVAQERLERGRVFLQRMQAEYPELAGHDVKDTPADGMCFLHAVLLQVGLDYKPLSRSIDLH